MQLSFFKLRYTGGGEAEERIKRERGFFNPSGRDVSTDGMGGGFPGMGRESKGIWVIDMKREKEREGKKGLSLEGREFRNGEKEKKSL